MKFHITLSIDESVLKKLDEFVSDVKESRSVIIERSITDYLGKQKPKSKKKGGKR